MTGQTSHDPMRERILQATFKLLCRHGYAKLNLSDVAAQAGISRPTLYKSFSSKDELLTAFSEFELRQLRDDLKRAIAGQTGRRRLDALLQFLVTSTAPIRCAGSSRSNRDWCSSR